MKQVERIGFAVLVFVGLLLTANAEESNPRLKVRSEDAGVAVDAFDFEAKKVAQVRIESALGSRSATVMRNPPKTASCFLRLSTKTVLNWMTPGVFMRLTQH